MANTGPTAWNSPDAFAAKNLVSAFEPYPMVTGSGYSTLGSVPIVHWLQPTPITLKNLVFNNSFAAGVPGATSQASTGSNAWTYGLTAFMYSRQDYATNSTNMSWLTSGSFGLSATLGYSSTSQQYGMSWITDSAGGTSNFTTTSNDAGWSNFASGPKAVSVPFPYLLPAGEYWLACQASSTSNTSNSNVTLLSVSMLQINAQQPNAVAGAFGASTTHGTVAAGAQNAMVATVLPSSTTAVSINSVGAARAFWFAMSNA